MSSAAGGGGARNASEPGMREIVSGGRGGRSGRGGGRLHLLLVAKALHQLLDRLILLIREAVALGVQPCLPRGP